MSAMKKGPGTTFPENWKEILVELGKQGKNNLAIFKAFNIGHSTHKKLVDNNEEYASAYEAYLIHHEAFMLEKAKQVLEEDGGATFDARLWTLIMGNKQRKRWKKIQ